MIHDLIMSFVFCPSSKQIKITLFYSIK